jgi:hypothetical protein
VVSYPIWSDPKARHHVWLQWHNRDGQSEGGISLSGLALGVAEHKYALFVVNRYVPALWAAFGLRVHGDREFLALAVEERYEEMHTAGVGEWLEQNGVPFSLWLHVAA